MATPNRTLRRTFLTGLIILLPLVVSIWVVSLLFGMVDGTLTPMVIRIIRLTQMSRTVEEAWVAWLAPVVSVFVALILIYLVGLLGGNVVGRQVLKWLEHLVLQVPVVRGVYSATRQFLDTFSREQKAFQKVVMVEFPRPGAWTIAFITNEAVGGLATPGAGDQVCVFVPTTPNPTGGYLLVVPRAQIRELAISVDDAFKLVISSGVLVPPGL